MKKNLLTFMCFFVLSVLFSQDVNVIRDNEESTPPIVVDFYKDASFCILIFGLVILLTMAFLIWKKSTNLTESFKYFCLVIVILVSLLLMTLGYSSSQITPVIGLLGTIAGYLLGKTQNNEDPNQTNR